MENRKRKSICKNTRQKIYNSLNGHCAYCGCNITMKEMQVDHIIPFIKGGEDKEENYLPACRSCNHYKSTLTIEQYRDYINEICYRLDSNNVTYRIAKRYGKVEDFPRKETVFYFER